MVANKRIIEAQDLPEGDKIYLRKSFLGWSIVKPIKDPDGSFNWPNLLFGGWKNLLMLLFILAVVLFHLHEDKLNIQAVERNCMGVCRYQYMLNNSVFLGEKDVNRSYADYVVNLSAYGGVLEDEP